MGMVRYADRVVSGRVGRFFFWWVGGGGGGGLFFGGGGGGGDAGHFIDEREGVEEELVISVLNPSSLYMYMTPLQPSFQTWFPYLTLGRENGSRLTLWKCDYGGVVVVGVVWCSAM